MPLRLFIPFRYIPPACRLILPSEQERSCLTYESSDDDEPFEGVDRILGLEVTITDGLIWVMNRAKLSARVRVRARARVTIG